MDETYHIFDALLQKFVDAEFATLKDAREFARTYANENKFHVAIWQQRGEGYYTSAELGRLDFFGLIYPSAG